MGVCGGKARPKKMFTLSKALEAKFQPLELELLYLIFTDLACRNVDNMITKSSFSDFFTMIGLWGDLVFDYFNQAQTNMVDFQLFVQGVEYFIKCDEEQKIEHLFRLYDLNREGNIKKEEFLQMLQNYPREDLIKLLDDPMFLEDENILKYHEKKQRNARSKPLKSNEQEISESIHQIKQRRNSRSMSILSQSDVNMPPLKEDSVNMLFPNPSMVGESGVPIGSVGQNLTFCINGKTVELKRVNLNYLVQKYVNMIYKMKSKDEQELSIDEFKTFVKKHPNIFHGLYKAFNFDIWGIDPEKNLPRLSIVPKDLEGTVYKQSGKPGKPVKERYFQVMQHFCLSFKRKEDALPRIICMDGLVVQELVNEQEQKYGFELSHKDKLYKSRTYFCSSFEEYKRWTNGLQIFQKASVNEHYSILQKIGEGKFSVVYLCEAKQNKETLAMKIIEKFKLSKQEKMMLAHETEIMKLLNHPCIIKFHEIIETKTHLNIITEAVMDGDLFDYIQKQEALCEQEASLIMGQLFDTLRYVHSIGIVHRDLKPENIMIVMDPSKTKVKHVKIIDFGFANFLTNIQQKEGEALCGTTNYLAPESLEQKKMTFKVDNFALGVILYLMLSGYLPFDSEFPEEIIKNIIDCKYDMEEEFWKGISADAKDLLNKLLNKEPMERISLEDALAHQWIVNRKELSTVKAPRVKHKYAVF